LNDGRNKTLVTSGSLESKYLHFTNTKAKAEVERLFVDQKNGMLLPIIASCKVSEVHVKLSGQWWDFESLPYNVILFFK
jgi:hypothetical protein